MFALIIPLKIVLPNSSSKKLINTLKPHNLMYLYSIIVFLAICYGFGYLATFFVKNSEHFFERHLMRIGIGLGTFVSVGYLLNLLHIPLDYRVFFGVITAGAFTAFAHRYRKHKTFFLEKPTFNINIYTVGMIVL